MMNMSPTDDWSPFILVQCLWCEDQLVHFTEMSYLIQHFGWFTAEI